MNIILTQFHFFSYFCYLFSTMNFGLLYKKIHIWRLRHISQSNYLLILSVVVGVMSGLAAVILKTLVVVVNRFLLNIEIPTFVGGNLMMLIYPLIGIVITMLFVRYVVGGDIGHGIPSVLFAISRKHGVLPARNMYSSLVASTLTVAFGGSVGLEAPIASTGSAIGSNIGRICRLSTKHVKMLLGCGAAGAVAGIFKAPIAGILFVVEILMFDLTSASAIPLMLSSISASTVAYFLMGTDVQFAFTVSDPFVLSQIPYYIVLGAFCAFSSVYFLRVTDKVETLFARIKSRWIRLLCGGMVLGLLIFLFPPLFGEGYGSLTALLHGNSDTLFNNSIFHGLKNETIAIIAMLIALILLKVVATATTIGSGGAGGTFGPSLIVGGLSGYFVATICNSLGCPPQSTANFALVGMAAVMTGVMHAPLMATFLIAEITGGYELMVPLLIAVAVTYICVNPFEKHSIYARKLAQHGDLLTHDKDQSAWHLMDLRKLIETDFIVVRQGSALRQLVEAIKRSHRNIFPVLDKDNHFVGVIHLDDVRKVIFQPELYDTHTIDEYMYSISEGDIVSINDSPIEVVNKFRVGNRYNLVVIDTHKNYLGVLSRANTFSAYRRFISESSEE